MANSTNEQLIFVLRFCVEIIVFKLSAQQTI